MQSAVEHQRMQRLWDCIHLSEWSFCPSHTFVDPVKATLLMSMCEAIAAPAVGPNPGTMFTTPGGKPAWHHHTHTHTQHVNATRSPQITGDFMSQTEPKTLLVIKWTSRPEGWDRKCVELHRDGDRMSNVPVVTARMRMNLTMSVEFILQICTKYWLLKEKNCHIFVVHFRWYQSHCMLFVFCLLQYIFLYLPHQIWLILPRMNNNNLIIYNSYLLLQINHNNVSQWSLQACFSDQISGLWPIIDKFEFYLRKCNSLKHK